LGTVSTRTPGVQSTIHTCERDTTPTSHGVSVTAEVSSALAAIGIRWQGALRSDGTARSDVELFSFGGSRGLGVSCVTTKVL
jgi:hypothetical protein